MTNNKKSGKAAEQRITLEVASKYFSYDPETGHFTVKAQTKTSKTPVGNAAGVKLSTGYTFIYVPFHGSVYAHRLAFLFMTGSWPKNIVDHLNHDSTDNRWENLRDVDYSQNNHNSKVRKDNKTGVRGVIYNKKYKKYSALLKHQNTRYWLGSFKTLEDAAQAITRKRAELGISISDECMFKR
ncbi:HNH endonuclease [Burkholderia multivorans]|uniref:HNH endonuclease n=1 Tax=Burkholderia multivorans TaxID=87883 RepID=UPI00138AC751|nr:HNH endonuclease [Burkholderia multivorans]MBU9472079.1 HNH endonuclease [Burkholderia multivorans]